jgi:hypothetical protein
MMHFLDEDRNGLLSWVELEVSVACTFCVHMHLCCALPTCTCMKSEQNTQVPRA